MKCLIGQIKNSYSSSATTHVLTIVKVVSMTKLKKISKTVVHKDFDT